MNRNLSKKKIRHTNPSQIWSRDSKNLSFYRDPRVIYVETLENWVGICRNLDKWKPIKLENIPATPKVNHQQEMKKYMDIHPEVSRVRPKALSSDKFVTKNPKWPTNSQSNFRPQRFPIRRDQS
tara:strand:- start:51 stop:422 length:372 start_codon:yes stop_codon:yes gene_type:complete